MEYLYDDLKKALYDAKRMCDERLVSLEGIVNNIVMWDYTDVNLIEKVFDELLNIAMFSDVKSLYIKLLDYYKYIDYDGYEFYKNEYNIQYDDSLEGYSL